jgi:hypothetical protein
MIKARDNATGEVLSGEAAIRALAAQTATLIKEVRNIEVASLRHR